MESPIAGGDTADELEVEMQLAERHRHEAPGLVSLIVRDAKPRWARGAWCHAIGVPVKHSANLIGEPVKQT